MTINPSPSPQVADAAADVLTELGPLSSEDLTAELERRGLPLGAGGDVRSEDARIAGILYGGSDRFTEVLGGRWAYLPSLLAGRVLTHRVSELEAEHDILTVSPDLDPLLEGLAMVDELVTSDGADLWIGMPGDAGDDPERGLDDDDLDEFGSLILPVGTLASLGVAAGDHVAVRAGVDGVELTTATTVAHPDEALGVRASALLAAEDESVEVLELVQTLMAEDRRAFTEALPPVTELLASWGLPTLDDMVAKPGHNFALEQVLQRILSLRELYDLEEDEALAVITIDMAHAACMELIERAEQLEDSGDQDGLAELFDELQSGRAFSSEDEADSEVEPGAGAADPAEGVEPPDPADRAIAATPSRAALREALSFLTEPYVARAILAEMVLTTRLGAAAMGMFSESAEPWAERRSRAPLRWLRARACEEVGRAAEAEQLLREAERLDHDWTPVLNDLARYAADRGDAAAALSLLRRSGDDAPAALLGIVEQYQRAPSRDLPRNAPCWCGSGRKFKQCHLRRADNDSLSNRAGWLYSKATQFVLTGSWIHDLTSLTYLRARYARSEAELEALATDLLATDLLLFQGGAFDDFVTRRGFLLPPDELALAQRWQGSERSIFEIEASRPGTSLTLLDLRSGDVTEVSEQTAGRTLREGQLIFARLLPVGDDEALLFGGIVPVDRGGLDELVELLDTDPTPADLVEFCSRPPSNDPVRD